MRSKGRQGFGGQGKAFGIHLKCGIIPLSALASRRLVSCYLSCLTIQLGDRSPGPNPDSSSLCLRGKDLRLFLLIQSRCTVYSQLLRLIFSEKPILPYSSSPWSLSCFLDLSLRVSRFACRFCTFIISSGPLHTYLSS